MVVGEVRLECIEDLPCVKALISPALGLTDDAVYECRTALSEAVANALIHGQRGHEQYCHVTVESRPGSILITVEDHGNGFDWAGLYANMPPPELDHGRGVPLIRNLMDAVSIRSTADGTRIQMVKRIPA